MAKIKNKDSAHFHSSSGISKIGDNLIIRNLTGMDIDMSFIFQDTPEAHGAFVIVLRPMNHGVLHKLELEDTS